MAQGSSTYILQWQAIEKVLHTFVERLENKKVAVYRKGHLHNQNPKKVRGSLRDGSSEEGHRGLQGRSCTRGATSTAQNLSAVPGLV